MRDKLGAGLQELGAANVTFGEHRDVKVKPKSSLFASADANLPIDRAHLHVMSRMYGRFRPTCWVAA